MNYRSWKYLFLVLIHSYVLLSESKLQQYVGFPKETKQDANVGWFSLSNGYSETFHDSRCSIGFKLTTWRFAMQCSIHCIIGGLDDGIRKCTCSSVQNVLYLHNKLPHSMVRPYSASTYILVPSSIIPSLYLYTCSNLNMTNEYKLITTSNTCIWMSTIFMMQERTECNIE